VGEDEPAILMPESGLAICPSTPKSATPFLSILEKLLELI
jgi:hypothetical protein